MKIKDIFNKQNLRQHLTDSSAILIESTPIFAALETGIAGMSNDVSVNARLYAMSLAYAGFGFAYGEGRDLWRKMFHVTQESKEKIQGICDFAYAAAFNSIAGPAIYYLSGCRDLKEAAIGTACGVGFGALNAWFIGYAIDGFRDLTGFKECIRHSYPNIIKKQSPKIKAGLAALLVAGSLALTSEVYHLNTLRHSNDKPTQIENTQQVKDITQKI